MGDFHYEKDAQGIVTITMDMDGPVNTMNRQFDGLFQSTVDKLCSETDLTGVIITSAKETFFAGGDLHWLANVEPGQEAEIFEYVSATKANMRRLEKLGVPVVAAINGAAAGGGFEIALACHHRIAVNTPKVKVGLPEVTLGLLPGGGGVVRMTWLLGIEGAMPYTLEGRMLSATKALDAKLIHETVADQDALIPRAKAYILENTGNTAAHTQPWDTKGYRIPGGPSHLPTNAPKLAMASAMLFKKTRGLLPGPANILDIMTQAAGPIDFESALRYETRLFAALTTKPETKNMIATNFFAMNKVNGGASRPKGQPKSTVKHLGILGAGMMGQGICYAAAMAGISVTIKDTSLEAAERGKAYTAKLLAKRVATGRLTEEAKTEILNRITATEDTKALKGCDLIIEAVFENETLKAQVLKEHEALLAEGGFWGSNTSTLPITVLAQNAANPARFIGLHFFSPVDKMPLLEIVVGAKTDEETVARAFDFARQIGKTPIVVNDGTGFFTSRTIGAKMEEAAQMVAEGIDPILVENLSRAVGFPTGLLSLYDEVKISLTIDIFDTQAKMGLFDPAKDPVPMARQLLRDMVNVGRKGRGVGGGFFDYSDTEKTPWSGLGKWRNATADIPMDDIKDRMLFRAIIETYKCLEEGILTSHEDANVGSIMGIGAPVHTGGYAQYVKTYGPARFVARCDALAEKYGPRFAAPANLRTMAM